MHETLRHVLLLGAAAVTAASVADHYDETAAQRDIWVNQAVGCPNVASWTCGRACDEVPTVARVVAQNRSKDTLALVARPSPTECLVVLRGSKTFLNTLQDVDFIPTDLEGCAVPCKVHEGFLHDWRSLAPQTLDALSTLGCYNSSIAITGHSLGAAMAALAAFELLGAQWPVRRVYTYGQPRTGNAAFAASFHARMAALAVPYFRSVEYRDAVPHLPVLDMFGEGWAHTFPEVYYGATERGHYVICAEPGDKRCSARWNLLQTLTHTCDHCSYLGMNPCDCGEAGPRCSEP